MMLGGVRQKSSKTFWALLGAPAEACQLVTDSCQATTAERIGPGRTPHIADEVRRLSPKITQTAATDVESRVAIPAEVARQVGCHSQIVSN